MSKYRSIEDINLNLSFPTVYLNEVPFTGEAFVMDGYNGYTCTENDAVIFDVKSREPLKDGDGLYLIAKGRRSAHFKFENGEFLQAV